MSKNTFKTTILLAALGGAFVLIGAQFGSTGATIGFGVALVTVGCSYWFSDKLAIAASRAQPVSEAEQPALHRIVRELSVSAGLPMPRVYMTPDPQPNAFATGRGPKNAVVAVTSGLMQLLDEAELRGVIAHELAHIRNRDILIGSVAAAIATAISWVAHLAFFFGGSDDDEGANPIAFIAMLFLAPVAAGLLQMAISRSREFEADRIGAEIAGKARPLAQALQKLETVAHRVPMAVQPAQAHKFIVNPLSGRTVNFARLFSTHPPVEERIERLLALG